MKFLRTASTGRLLAVIAGLVGAIAAGTAMAVAASGSGPVPKAKPLASAIHDALSGPSVTGISARITFTNNLIGAPNFQGSDPLLQGASGRLWLAGGHRLRLELQSDNGDAQLVLNGSSFWISDPTSHTVYEGTLPSGASSPAKSGSAAKSDSKPADQGIPSIAQIQSELSKLMKHLNVSSAIPGDIAGQAAYTVRVSPKHDGGLLGDVQIAWDAIRGVPLRIAIYARNNPTPVLELKATDISYGKVPTSDLNISKPAGSKIVTISTVGHPSAAASMLSSKLRSKLGKHARHAEVQGVAAVASALPFKLTAPAALIGLPRHDVRLLNWGGKPAALLTYGQNLGGVVVIEQTQPVNPTAPMPSSSNQGGDSKGFSLPTVSINGATGQELDTPLGTVIRFSRAGVAYTVLGSVPSAAADLAARAL